MRLLAVWIAAAVVTAGAVAGTSGLHFPRDHYGHKAGIEWWYFTAYVRDADGFHPVLLQDNVTREQLVQTSEPVVVGHRTEVVHRNKHGWEKDALIIGGSAGGGALVGALAGGKKGAGIGAAAGGIGGLIYDLARK